MKQTPLLTGQRSFLRLVVSLRKSPSPLQNSRLVQILFNHMLRFGLRPRVVNRRLTAPSRAAQTPTASKTSSTLEPTPSNAAKVVGTTTPSFGRQPASTDTAPRPIFGFPTSSSRRFSHTLFSSQPTPSTTATRPIFGYSSLSSETAPSPFNLSRQPQRPLPRVPKTFNQLQTIRLQLPIFCRQVYHRLFCESQHWQSRAHQFKIPLKFRRKAMREVVNVISREDKKKRQRKKAREDDASVLSSN
jgi:hypothetical protein